MLKTITCTLAGCAAGLLIGAILFRDTPHGHDSCTGHTMAAQAASPKSYVSITPQQQFVSRCIAAMAHAHDDNNPATEVAEYQTVEQNTEETLIDDHSAHESFSRFEELAQDAAFNALENDQKVAIISRLIAGMTPAYASQTGALLNQLFPERQEIINSSHFYSLIR